MKRIPLSDQLKNRSLVVSCGCHIWTGCEDKNGYGFIRHKGKNLKAHRVSWMIYRGEIPDGMCVCHKCDIPQCTNPKHLFLGTFADNNHDCIAKGRGGYLKTRQINNRNKDVVLRFIKECKTQVSIAKELGICRQAIYRFLKRN